MVASLKYVVLILLASSAFGADAVLPYYNADGYKTEFGLTNNTNADIELLGDGQIYGCVCPKPSVKAHSFKRIHAPLGLGVKSVPLPDGIKAYAVVTTPSGAQVRIESLSARETSYVYDIGDFANYNGGLFIGALEDADVSIEGGASFRLRAGEARISASPSATAKVTNEWAGDRGQPKATGKLYVFGFINHWLTGSVQAVAAQ